MTPILVIFIMSTEFWISRDIIVVVAALCSFSMMLKLLDWMRLFNETSFYILLIRQTMSDVGYFVLLIVISLMLFGIPIVMLNMNRDEDHPIVTGDFSFWLPNMIVNQYLLALGEFSTDEFGEGE